MKSAAVSVNWVEEGVLPVARKRPVAVARRGPGRPRVETNAREDILRAAAAGFADRGYAAVSIREVARAAGVQIATLYYHYPSKVDLLQAVLNWVMRPVQEARAAALARLRAQPALNLHDVLTAFIGPSLLLSSDPDYGALARRLASVIVNDPSPEVRAALAKVYAATMHDFIALMRKSAPDLPAADLHWSIVCTFGILHYVQSDLGRMAMLLGAPLDEAPEAVTAIVAGFIARGFGAPPAG
jgi:AcrR family transcriptional regulator